MWRMYRNHYARFSSSKNNNNTASYQNGNLNNQMSLDEACAILEINKNANHIVIMRAYREKMFKYHPDRGGDENMAIKINLARDILLKSKS